MKEPFPLHPHTHPSLSFSLSLLVIPCLSLARHLLLCKLVIKASLRPSPPPPHPTPPTFSHHPSRHIPPTLHSSNPGPFTLMQFQPTSLKWSAVDCWPKVPQVFKVIHSIFLENWKKALQFRRLFDFPVFIRSLGNLLISAAISVFFFLLVVLISVAALCV